MRRRLLQSLPALARYCHLMPWDLERLTLRELQVFLDHTAKFATSDRNNSRR